jgi:peptidoglycan/xylan/chitin deacetylase (PgdA/CDA1 family)
MFGGTWRRRIRGSAIRERRIGANLQLAVSASRTRSVWPAPYRAAVSFSFDDARPSQITCGLPVLERLGVASTFFVLPKPVAADRRAWAAAVERGHEIGNHTVTHPCGGSAAWRGGYALQRLSLSDMRKELQVASTRIRELLGVDPWVFAYPCGQTFVGRGTGTQSYVPLVAELFGVGRTFNDRWDNSPIRCDLAQVACVNSDGIGFEVLRPRLEQNANDGGWLVLGGHEIGTAGNSETTTVETLEAVVHWCREHAVLIDTVGAVGRHVESARPGNEGRREA